MLQPFDRKSALRRVMSIVDGHIKDFGYERMGSTWKLMTQHSDRLLNVQTHRRDDLSHLTFTINLGVFFPELYRAQHGSLPNPPIQEEQCSPRTRIGWLVGNSDKWWTVDRNTDESSLASELNSVIGETAMPWLTKLDSMQDALEELLRQEEYFDAAIAAHALEHADTTSLLKKALKARPPGVARRAVEIWARDNGLSTMLE